ncbi:MAG: hypothetical protein AAB756_01850, partial [Patescibacteria group bacterium]
MASQTAQNSKSTQEFVPIKEVRDGVVVLKDGGLRLILIASSLNLALKSEDEQRATISQFQNFLNSLDFSVQIYVSSRRLDIRPYIALLEERLKAQMEDLLKIQIREYIDFVKNFTERSSIMTKNFFIVVPYTQPLLGGKKGFSILPSKKGTAEKKLDDMEAFEEARSQLEQRASVVEQGLSGMGIRVIQLGTEEVVELFYKIFNPGETELPM